MVAQSPAACKVLVALLAAASLGPRGALGFVCRSQEGEDTPGYDNIEDTDGRDTDAFAVTATCARGFRGSARAEPCTSAGGQYTWAGCIEMTCGLVSDVGEIMPALFRSTVRKGKPRKNTGTAGGTGTGTAGGDDNAPMALDSAPVDSTLIYECTDHGFEGTAILTCGTTGFFEVTQDCDCSGWNWGGTSCVRPWMMGFIAIVILAICACVG